MLPLATLLAGVNLRQWLAAAALAAVAVFGTVQTLRLAAVRADLAAEQRERAADVARLEQAAREQADRFRATERDWRALQDENAIVARKARDLASAHAAARDAADTRLHSRVAALAAGCSPAAASPAAVAPGQAASSPGALLANMLGRMGAAARIVVDFADAAAISGEQCAADYEALTQRVSGE